MARPMYILYTSHLWNFFSRELQRRSRWTKKEKKRLCKLYYYKEKNSNVASERECERV